MPSDRLIPLLLTLAWLAPLAGAVATWAAGRLSVDRTGRLPVWIAVAGAAVSLNLALAAGFVWWRGVPAPTARWAATGSFNVITGAYYTLGEFGGLSLSVEYFIDSLTVLMFAVVTLIAACVHVYAVAYMDEGRETRDESPEDAALGEGRGPQGSHLPRFFALLQLFLFSMLGLVLAGNLLQAFAFWELVGAISYLLIGFYFDRPHAAGAATKAFVMNRVGDAGFLVGIAILWTAFGTVSLGGHANYDYGFASLNESRSQMWFRYYKPASGLLERYAETTVSPFTDGHREWYLVGPQHALRDIPRWWLVAAGLCIFAGCVGKSAQLPLATWLPDAMAGPTPVSALVHSATMVAAGVYLVGRLYPLFLPEVLTAIAYVGAATLVYGATCALVQTDLKRLLAYSTVSQLGYMMLALGVGGREAGLFHLVTHAFFKGLLFLAAGSVIVACHHVQDLDRLGGLRKRMPLTAWTSLVGVIALAGLAVPFVEPFGHAIALSGYHSKDSILAAALAFTKQHPGHGLLFALPLVTAGLTAFYMFRFWLLTFAGRPRDEDLHRHVRESSPLMTVPLVVLATFAALSAVGGERGALFAAIQASSVAPSRVLTGEDPWRATVESSHAPASLWGLLAAGIGTALAFAIYGARLLDPARLRAAFGPGIDFLHDGWKLDRLYRSAVVRPVEFVSFAASLFDRLVIDRALLGVTRLTVAVARFDREFDEHVVDGAVNRLAEATYAAGRALRHVQTGHVRQYVMALAAAAVILFALAIVLIPK